MTPDKPDLTGALDDIDKALRFVQHRDAMWLDDPTVNQALTLIKQLREAVPEKPHGQCGPWCRAQDTSNAFCKYCNNIFEWEQRSATILNQITEKKNG